MKRNLECSVYILRNKDREHLLKLKCGFGEELQKLVESNARQI